jgi:mono/diheme cytochrome c family protein
MFRFGATLVLVLALGMITSPSAAGQDRPAAVTDSVIEVGSMVFHERGGCADCHGRRGEGSEAGPSLRDGEWRSGSGTYEEILEQVVHGKPRTETETGEPMPMRGVSGLSDRDVRAVAAYVWAISHPER